MRKVMIGFGLLAALAGCGDHKTEQAAPSGSDARHVAGDDSVIECAAAGASAFSSDCTVARTETDRGLVLTVSHSDGHFHRLLVTTDGRGVIAADGAQRATVTMLDPNRIEVAIAGDRYRLPAHTGAPAR